MVRLPDHHIGRTIDHDQIVDGIHRVGVAPVEISQEAGEDVWSSICPVRNNEIVWRMSHDSMSDSAFRG